MERHRPFVFLDPKPFTVMPILYDRAYGGVDDRPDDPSKHAAFMANPIGRVSTRTCTRNGSTARRCRTPKSRNRAVRRPSGDNYTPMALGPWVAVGSRAFRYRRAPTTTRWLEEQSFHFSPADFDERSYQAAPLDQQIPSSCGRGEEVRLVNLVPEGQLSFGLPVLDAPVHFFPKNGIREDGRSSLLDTIVLEPDLIDSRLTWRAMRPLKRNIFEVAQTVIGSRHRRGGLSAPSNFRYARHGAESS